MPPNLPALFFQKLAKHYVSLQANKKFVSLLVGSEEHCFTLAKAALEGPAKFQLLEECVYHALTSCWWNKAAPHVAEELLAELFAIRSDLPPEAITALELVDTVAKDPAQVTKTLEEWQRARTQCKSSALKLCRQYNNLSLGVQWNLRVDNHIQLQVALKGSMASIEGVAARLDADVSRNVLMKSDTAEISQFFGGLRRQYKGVLTNAPDTFQEHAKECLEKCEAVFKQASDRLMSLEGSHVDRLHKEFFVEIEPPLKLHLDKKKQQSGFDGTEVLARIDKSLSEFPNADVLGIRLVGTEQDVQQWVLRSRKVRSVFLIFKWIVSVIGPGDAAVDPHPDDMDARDVLEFVQKHPDNASYNAEVLGGASDTDGLSAVWEVFAHLTSALATLVNSDAIATLVKQRSFGHIISLATKWQKQKLPAEKGFAKQELETLGQHVLNVSEANFREYQLQAERLQAADSNVPIDVGRISLQIRDLPLLIQRSKQLKAFFAIYRRAEDKSLECWNEVVESAQQPMLTMWPAIGNTLEALMVKLDVESKELRALFEEQPEGLSAAELSAQGKLLEEANSLMRKWLLDAGQSQFRASLESGRQDVPEEWATHVAKCAKQDEVDLPELSALAKLPEAKRSFQHVLYNKSAYIAYCDIHDHLSLEAPSFEQVDPRKQFSEFQTVIGVFTAVQAMTRPLPCVQGATVLKTRAEVCTKCVATFQEPNSPLLPPPLRAKLLIMAELPADTVIEAKPRSKAPSVRDHSVAAPSTVAL